MTLDFSPAPGSADLHVRLFDPARRPDDLPEALAAAATREPLVTHDGERLVARIALDAKTPDAQERARDAAAKAGALALRLRTRTVSLQAPDAADPEALVEGFRLAAYVFREHKTGDAPPAPERLTLVHPDPETVREAAERALIRAEAACVARDLVNRSPHVKTAPRFARAVAALAREAGLRAEVWGRARIEAEGMGGLLAVNRGSVEPPRFVVLEHAPEGTASDAPVVLVGKAVVFDTGGVSLKPTAGSMDRMKADMGGAAAVVGAMLGAARLGLPARVVALLPMTDNRPGGDAYLPGDVVTMHDGSTVEVLNTDAEGRMLLADALSYARSLEPRFVVDAATLTGAALIALGTRVAALCTPDDEDAASRTTTFLDAARRTGERLHPLPMFEHYAELLDSDVADVKNVGGREAGTITAAKFLERFTRNAEGRAAYPWVHLDIAGPAFPEKPPPHMPKGATGFGVRLLLAWLEESYC